jgi:hypothetical protein
MQKVIFLFLVLASISVAKADGSEAEQTREQKIVKALLDMQSEAQAYNDLASRKEMKLAKEGKRLTRSQREMLVEVHHGMAGVHDGLYKAAHNYVEAMYPGQKGESLNDNATMTSRHYLDPNVLPAN